jgi:hypothetical protein
MPGSLLNELLPVCQDQRLMGIFFVGSNPIDELGENDLGGLADWVFAK